MLRITLAGTLAVVSLMAVPGTGNSQPLSTSKIAAEATPATVTIISIDADGDTIGTGSGFIVRSNGTIVTNWHVLRGASSAVVILASKERYDRVAFLEGDSTADLAIIKIPGYGLPILTPRQSAPPVGERVVAIGSPFGLSHTVTEGIVSAIRLIDGRKYVQISAAISPGSSGGAVLDDRGRVFAVSTSYLEGGQQLNFAVPVRYALGLIPAAPHEQPLASVFGDKSPVTRTGDPHASYSAARGEADSDAEAYVARATRIRPDLAGAYTLFITNGERHQLGALVVDGRRGWMLVDSTMYHVDSIGTDRSGDMAIDVAGLLFAGFQNRVGGFTATTVAETKVGIVGLAASPYEIPKTKIAGLYDTGCRTTYYQNGNNRGATLEWNGTATALMNEDTLYVQVTMRNDRGGNAALFGSSRLDSDGSFAVALNDPYDEEVYLLWIGTVTSGRMAGRWVDHRRKGTWFECHLVATRK
jgi:S1-C subfamily serine protease